eukprot:357673-Chlamydomonas_euryale.AAC.2
MWPARAAPHLRRACWEGAAGGRKVRHKDQAGWVARALLGASRLGGASPWSGSRCSPNARPNARPNALPNARPNAWPNALPNMRTYAWILPTMRAGGTHGRVRPACTLPSSADGTCHGRVLWRCG